MKKLTNTTLLITFFVFTSIAQRNSQPGYIILAGKDTIRGTIDYRDWNRNPSSISFAQVSAQPRVYAIKELSAFGIDGRDNYRTAIVMIDKNPVTVTDVQRYNQNLVQTDTIALRLLTEGNKAILYEFVDFKQHYFIQRTGGSIEELAYKVKMDSLSLNLRTYNDFRMQLQSLFANQGLSAEQMARIGNLNYKEKDLVHFVDDINGSTTTYKNRVLDKKTNKPQFFAGAGIVLSNFKFSSNDEAFSTMKFDKNISYIISAGVDFFEKRNRQNFFLRLELSVSHVEGKGSGTSVPLTTPQKNEYSFKQNNITPGVSANYTFLRFSQSKIYAGLGAGFNFSSYPEHLLVITSDAAGTVARDERYPSLEKIWLGLYARLGLIVTSKVEVGLSGQIGGSFISSPSLKENLFPVFLRVLYRFH